MFYLFWKNKNRNFTLVFIKNNNCFWLSIKTLQKTAFSESMWLPYFLSRKKKISEILYSFRKRIDCCSSGDGEHFENIYH